MKWYERLLNFEQPPSGGLLGGTGFQNMLLGAGAGMANVRPGAAQHEFLGSIMGGAQQGLMAEQASRRAKIEDELMRAEIHELTNPASTTEWQIVEGADGRKYRVDKAGIQEPQLALPELEVPEAAAGMFAGKDGDERAMNVLLDIANKEANGEPIPPELARQGIMAEYALTKSPFTVQGPGGEVYQYEGMTPPSLSRIGAAPGPAPVTSEALPTGPSETAAPPGARVISGKKPLPAETGSKVAMAETGMMHMQAAMEGLFEPDGSINQTVRAELLLPTGPVSARARQVENNLKRGIRNKLRLESGAAVPDSEVEAEYKLTLPGLLDDAATARQKIMGIQNLYQSFLGTQNRAPATETPSGEGTVIEWNPDWN